MVLKVDLKWKILLARYTIMRAFHRAAEEVL